MIDIKYFKLFSYFLIALNDFEQVDSLWMLLSYSLVQQAPLWIAFELYFA